MSKYAKITLEKGGIYVQPIDELDVLLQEIHWGDIGDRWTVELIEMTDEEYQGLEEFEGH